MTGPTARGIARRALATHRGAWGAIAVAALIALAPAAVLQGLLEREAVSQAESPVLFVVLTVEAAAAGVLGYFFLSGVVAQIAIARRRGTQHPRLREIARELPWWNLLVVDLIVSVGTAVGLQLMVVPGLVFVTWYGLAAVLVETRHLSPRPALVRSRELARGHFWLVLSLLVLPLVLVTGLGYLLKELTGALLALSSQIEYGIAALLAGVLVKPFAAVINVELAIELDEARPPSKAAGDAR